MDERSFWEEYKGKKILVNDYSGLSKAEILERIKINEEMIPKLGPGILLLVDVANDVGTPELISAFKHIAKAIQPFIEKGAIVGVVGIQKVLLTAVNRFSDLGLKPYDSRQEAKNYLVTSSSHNPQSTS